MPHIKQAHHSWLVRVPHLAARLAHLALLLWVELRSVQLDWQWLLWVWGHLFALVPQSRAWGPIVIVAL